MAVYNFRHDANFFYSIKVIIWRFVFIFRKGKIRCNLNKWNLFVTYWSSINTSLMEIFSLFEHTRNIFRKKSCFVHQMQKWREKVCFMMLYCLIMDILNTKYWYKIMMKFLYLYILTKKEIRENDDVRLECYFRSIPCVLLWP